MRIGQQVDAVERFSALAESRESELQLHRSNFRHWKQRTFGSVEGLTVSFALGAWWGASRKSGEQKDQQQQPIAASINRKAIGVGAINATWLASRFLNNAISTGFDVFGNAMDRRADG